MGRAPKSLAWGTMLLAPTAIVLLAAPTVTSPPREGPSPAAVDVTFTKDVAPILQRSCQGCHRPNGVAPMPLITYKDVQPWAPRIKFKTQLGLNPRAGAMPPYYAERDIGIQHYKDDQRLSVEEIATLAAWADAGAPE